MEKDLYEAGLKVRKAVLGEAYVDRVIQNASDFTRPMQELVTEFCWGSIWTRPGLQRKIRSLLNLGMLTSLGKSSELRLHVKGAIRNGCTKDEIMETLLQATVYCGVPSGVEAFRIAQEALSELDGS